MDPGKKQRKAAAAEVKKAEKTAAATLANTQARQDQERARQAAIDADKAQRSNLASNLLFGNSAEAQTDSTDLTKPKKKLLGE